MKVFSLQKTSTVAELGALQALLTGGKVTPLTTMPTIDPSNGGFTGDVSSIVFPQITPITWSAPFGGTDGSAASNMSAWAHWDSLNTGGNETIVGFIFADAGGNKQLAVQLDRPFSFLNGHQVTMSLLGQLVLTPDGKLADKSPFAAASN